MTGTSRSRYGCNKLYCEHLGRYYAKHYKQLSESVAPRVDFRCVRFPGLISAVTLPSGGTSDYASEMIHAAAGGDHICFVRPDSRIPFMAMPDARSPPEASVVQPDRLSCTAHNVKAFSPSADEIRDAALEAPSREDRLQDRGEAPGHHRLVARGRGRCGRASRLGLFSGYDFDRAFHEHSIPNIPK